MRKLLNLNKHISVIRMAMCCMAFLFSGNALFSQSISGKVTGENSEGLSGAVVRLLAARDSVLVKLAISDNTGAFGFDRLKEGRFFISVTHIGYQSYISAVIDLSNLASITENIIMKRQAGELSTVTVSSRKPLVEIRPDRQIMNIDASINSIGSDALDLLRKAPGLFVDPNDNISMSGKSGTMVYIDGKASPLTGKMLTDYLRTLPSSLIESIEIITSPPARYDASGNAGIINIRLKKDKSLGTNGSITLGYAIGYYPKLTGVVSINNRSRHHNLFATYSAGRIRNRTTLQMERYLQDTLFNQFGVNEWLSINHNIRSGIDFYLDKKSTLGLVVNASFTDQDNDSNTETPFIYLPDRSRGRQLNATNENDISRTDLTANLNYRRTINKSNEWTADFDYGRFKINSYQFQPNVYFDGGGLETSRRVFAFDSPTGIDYFSFKSDYDITMKKGKVGIGIKSSSVNVKNSFVQYLVNGNVKLPDSSQINDFDYREKVNAAYFNYSRTVKKFNFQMGLRLENTNIVTNGFQYVLKNGRHVGVWEENRRSFTDLFPSFSLGFNPNSSHSLGLNAGRRIDRVPFQDLNPFELKIDEYTYYKGNPALRPQYTFNVSAYHSYKKRIITRLSYSNVREVFAKLVDTIYQVKSFQISQNLSSQQVVSLSVNYQFNKRWYTLNSTLNAFRSRYQADFGSGRQIDLSANTVQLNVQQYFNLGKGFAGEISGFYTSPSLWSGTFRTKELFSVDAGLQKKVMKGNGSVKLSFSDMFRILWWQGRSVFAGQEVVSTYRWEAQQFKLNFNCRFGNSQVKAPKNKQLSVDDEGKRVKTSQGGLN